MSWLQAKKLDLDSVLPQYKKISEAPQKAPDILRDEYYEGKNISAEGWDKINKRRQAWIAEERKRRYKAVDAHGNIWLVMNPKVWKLKQYNDGSLYGKAWYRERPLPTFALSAEDAKKQAGGRQGATTMDFNV